MSVDMCHRGVASTGRPLRAGALYVLAALAPAAVAQPSIELNVSTREVYVNEPFTLEVEVRNFENCEEPTPPALSNARLSGPGGASENNSISIINGRKSVLRSRSYPFEITPLSTGKLVIGPFTVVADGRTLSTRPVTLTVGASDAGSLLLAEVTCDEPRLYVGQKARLTLSIYVKPARFGDRLLSDRDMLSQFRGSSFGPFPQEVSMGETRRPGPDGKPEHYYTYKTQADVVLDRPGPLPLDDVALSLYYPTRFGRDLFGELTITGQRRIRVTPTLPDIEVQPLPVEGRPAGFAGAVGRLALSARARPTTVRVGDPIELTIDISGDGPIETLPAPTLGAQSDLAEAFRIPTESLAGAVERGRKRYTQTLRPKRPDVTAIPPIEYPYFDPQRGEYVVARSAPIPITVSVAEQLEASDLTGMASPQSARPGAAVDVVDGLRGNVTDESRLLSSSFQVRTGHLVALTVVPPVAFLASWGYGAFVRARRADPVRRRRATALRNALRRVDGALGRPARDIAHEIEAALAQYMADRFNQPPARFAGRDLVSFLEQRNAAGAVQRRLTELLDACERASYAGLADGDCARLSADARACLDALERERL
jgi:hypothetical protein